MVESIIFSSNGSGTVRATRALTQELMKCENVRTFMDAGWFCATGWLGKKFIALHFNSKEEYLDWTDQSEFKRDPYGYHRGPKF
jgi:hypothetical protein